MLNRLSPPKGATKKRKRLGRGESSGVGKTSGRGHKGQRSRSGGRVKPGFEGGQMPLQRRLPKRGFTNIFKKEYSILNVGRLEGVFKAGDTVDRESLLAKGLVKKAKLPLKVLAQGDLNISLTVKADVFSAAAKAKIEAAGGKAEV